MRVLVTAFEPFGGDPENASLEAVRALESTFSEPGIELVTAVLPVSLDAFPALLAAAREYEPDAVLAVGEAGGRREITPERQGVNENTFRIPDNAGNQPQHEPIEADGPAARASGFDVDALVAAIAEVGLPARASDDAGRFLCNHVAYRVADLPVPGGFVHVPAIRIRGAATVGAETDPGAAPGGAAGGEGTTALTSADLGTALAACVRVIAGE